MKRQRTSSTAAPSVNAILSDNLTAVSLEHWAGDAPKAFDAALVKQLYEQNLRDNADVSRVQMLETSKYLEAYLWPNFASSSSREHVLSIVMLINEKFRERAHVFDFLTSDAKRVSLFFTTLCNATWIEAAKLSLWEEISLVRFLVGAFQNLAHESVRVELLKLVHLPLWDAVSPVKRNYELEHVAPKPVQKQWRLFEKQKSKGKSFARESSFFPFLFASFFRRFEDEKEDQQLRQLFVGRFLELCIDLLSQLPTRRYFKMFVEDSQLLAKLQIAPKNLLNGSILTKLVQQLRYYLEFEVDEYTGAALSPEEISRVHASRVASLQSVAYRVAREKEAASAGNEVARTLREFAISNVSSIASRSHLERLLERLSDKQTLFLLAQAVGIRTDSNDEKLVQESLVLFCQIRSSQVEVINRIPVYPTEDLMWDESVIPSDSYSGQHPLPLPKLNLQFLTFFDYLLRNYNLYRLEAAYDLRDDVENVISRMSPKRLGDGKTKFEGWARQALPVRSCKILDISEPLLGETKPAQVRMEVIYSVHHFKGELREEWERIRQHDILFLLAMSEPSPTAASSKNAAAEFGLTSLRGCEVLEVWDEQGNRVRSAEQKKFGEVRRLVVKLDSAQYMIDTQEQRQSIYSSFNLIMKRDGAENTFKGVLETVRTLINTPNITVPDWLKEVFLGFGNVKTAVPDREKPIDYHDTFLDAKHVRECFPGAEISFVPREGPPPYKVEISADGKRVAVHPYSAIDNGPFPEDIPRQNKVRFTARQVQAIGSGANDGLTLIVGPPGTGKTDTAVQILSLLYRQHPTQRILMLTHSNAALNQIFEKLIGLDIDPTQMVRMGHGEKHLDTQESFSQEGRVNVLLARRFKLLDEVSRLAQSLGLPQDASYTCETAHQFFFQHVVSRWEKFTHDVNEAQRRNDGSFSVARAFPFSAFFVTAPRQPLFVLDNAKDLESARACYRHLERVFRQLDEIQPLEVLRSPYERASYVLVKHSRIVAMTVTFAGLMRQNLVEAGFRFDSVVMEEAGQVKEIESFIPLLMQEQKHAEDRLRLKRVVLIGDDNQLPPVVKNPAFERYSNLDQSLFARFVRLGVPHVVLDMQGRARPSMAKLFSWRYPSLGNLPRVHNREYQVANPGFRYDYQVIDVADYQGVGESCPKTHFFQNIGEAEYLVATYMYMRTLGYPASSIAMLTTYRGQKHLLRDVVNRRCANLPQYGMPFKITTVDKFQGQQADYVLLSLVRTKHVGHIRDVRRLVVAMSRARLGLYVFCRLSLLQNCYELSPVFSQLWQRPTQLQLIAGEKYGDKNFSRGADDEVEAGKVVEVADLGEMGKFAAVGFDFSFHFSSTK